MKEKTKISISWSGGKDSCLMLWYLLNDPAIEVVELHTAISTTNDRVSMHGVHKSLIKAQANSLGIPIRFLSVPPSSTNNEYEKALSEYYTELISRDIKHIGFGDIFLADLKKYRDALLANHGLTGVYPLWEKQTKDLSRLFVANGFQTVICAASMVLFPDSITGKVFDNGFLNTLPSNVDPCGENGEFHSFAFDGPCFSKPIEYKAGEVVSRTYSQGNKSTSFEFVELELLN